MQSLQSYDLYIIDYVLFEGTSNQELYAIQYGGHNHGYFLVAL